MSNGLLKRLYFSAGTLAVVFVVLPNSANADGNGFWGYGGDRSSASGSAEEAGRDFGRYRQDGGPAQEQQESFGGDQEAASYERREIAAGHYARARALLIEALGEFERGRTIASPDMVINGDQWREGVSARKGDLDRVLNPQPRTSVAGARFPESKKLLKEVREPLAETAPRAALKRPLSQLSPPIDEDRYGVEISNKGEKDIIKDVLTPTPAPVKQEKPAKKAVKSKAKKAPENTQEEAKAPVKGSDLERAKLEKELIDEIQKESDQAPVEAKSSELPKSGGDQKPEDQNIGEPAPAASKPANEAVNGEEEPEVSKAIQDAVIQERLKRLTEEITAEERKRQKSSE